jgi:hypothetical protein
MTDSSRERWLLRVGHWLLALDFEAPGLTGEAAAQALGAAWFAVRMKGIEGFPERSIWGGARRGSLGWKWGHAHSNAKHSVLDNPGLTWGQMLTHELNAATAEPGAAVIPVLEHDRRKDGQVLIDPDLPKAVEPVYRKIRRRGHQLDAGVDYLAVVRELLARGFSFPPGCFRDGDLELVGAFSEKTDAELAAEEGVSPAAIRKRRERLRRRMSQTVKFIEEGAMHETTTLVQRVEDHEQRLRELERQVGVPEGGDKAAQAAVDSFLREVQEEQAEEEHG